MSYTTLVNVDADTALKLVDFIGDLVGDDKFKMECNDYIQSSNGDALIGQILSKESEIFGMEDDMDIEGCVQTIVSVMLMLGADSEGTVKKFLSTLTSKKGGTANNERLRLKLLVTLFNMLSQPLTKFMAICATFNYALETNQEAQVLPFLGRGDKWAAAWQLDQAKQQELALVIYKIANKIANSEHSGRGGPGKASSSSKEALKYLIAYLRAFPSGSCLPDSAVQITLPTLVDALKGSASSFEQRNVLLEGLKSSPAGNSSSEPLKSLMSLLDIVCTGNQSQYDDFIKIGNGPSVMKENGLDDAHIANTLRVLSLGALAASKPRLTYKEIASSLNLSSMDDVEMLVVEAIAQGVLEATMDQFEQTITVTKCSHRAFGPAQWTDLQSRLKTLKANISSVFDEIAAK